MKISCKNRILFLLVVFMLSLPTAAQSPQGKSLTKKQKKAVSRKKSPKPAATGLFGKNTKGNKRTSASKAKQPKQVKEAEKKKKQRKKAYEKARKKEIKRRYKMQTPETQKRMKQTRKEADYFNTGGKQNIWQKIFGGSRKKKDRKKKNDKKKSP